MDAQELDKFQQREIELGKDSGIAVELYNNPRYSYLQMKEIRLGLEHKINVKCYAHPGFSAGIMREVRLALMNKVNIIRYVKQGYDATTLREIRLALEEDHNLDVFLKDGYAGEQLREIRLSLGLGKVIRKYITLQMRAAQIAQIRRGLEKALDVSIYAKEEYSWQQMMEIRLGLETHLNISSYMNRYFDYLQMREIRLGLAAGMDVSSYAKLQFSLQDMHVRRMNMISRYKGEKVEGDVKLLINDNIANVYITPDKLKAYIELKVQDATNNYNTDDVMKMLEENGINRGVCIADIHTALLNENYYFRFIAALGKQPEQGKNGYYEYRIDPGKNAEVSENTDGSVNYLDIFKAEGVRRNQILVKYHFAEEGIPGWTIFGEELPAKKGKELAVMRCDGVKLSDDATTYTAMYDGRAVVTTNSVSVYRMLWIDGDYKRGMEDINFDGDVLIRGSVISGVTVRATHDIMIDGSVEPSNLIAGGNVYIRAGILGNDIGRIEAGKNIYGNYFEKANLCAQGSIYATSLLNCNAEAYEKISVSGSKGVILGGTLYAMGGIEANVVGNIYRVKSKLIIGANDDLLTEVAKTKAEYSQISATLLDMQAQMQKIEGKLMIPEAQAVYYRIKHAYDEESQEQIRLKTNIEQLDAKMEKDKRAKVSIRQKIYPGIMILAGNVSLTIDDEMSNVAIKNVGGTIKLLFGNVR